MKKTINFIILSLVTFGMFLAACSAFSSCISSKYNYNSKKYGCPHRDINTRPFNK